MEDNEIVLKWNALREAVTSCEQDVVKNARGVAAAGVRARAGLRAIKQQAAVLVKLTVELDKQTRASRAASKAAKKAAEAAAPTA